MRGRPIGERRRKEERARQSEQSRERAREENHALCDSGRILNEEVSDAPYLSVNGF